MPSPYPSLPARAREQLLSLPPSRKLPLIIAADTLVMLIAVASAAWFQYGAEVKSHGELMGYAAITVLGFPGLSLALGLYRVVVRHLNAGAAARIALCCGASSLPLPFAALMLGDALHQALGFWFLTFSTATLGLIGARLSVKHWLTRGKRSRSEKMAIFGAGAAGRQLLSVLRRGQEMEPIAFLDEDPHLHRRELDGLTVLDPSDPNTLNRLKLGGCKEILVCIPSISGQHRKHIIQKLRDWPFRLKTVPDLTSLMSGNASIDDVHEVALEDLLGRDPVPPNQSLLDRCVRGKVVLVSGAGGSIGSELCRQAVKFGAAKLLLVEHSEYALYEIHQELRTLAGEPTTALTPLLACVTDEARMQQIFSTWQVDTVYHAAAYKHVPLVQHNPVQGIRNNAFGTLSIARAAAANQVKHFTLISTDKAVRPTNFMGASKRLAELVVQAAQFESTGTTFSMVRFGNVLGSSGSVIPLFKQQIASGGPVTVTHPEITRYFMTISEAVELVIQAGAMASGGDVFVLDMGKPFRIYDLARRIIQFAGRSVRDDANPDGDIAIQFTGLRPGEKLYEELLIGAEVEGTEHPKIMRAFESLLTPQALQAGLAQLQGTMQSHDIKGLTTTLTTLVTEFQPLQADADWVAQEQRSANQSLLAGSVRLQ